MINMTMSVMMMMVRMVIVMILMMMMMMVMIMMVVLVTYMGRWAALEFARTMSGRCPFPTVPNFRYSGWGNSSMKLSSRLSLLVSSSF